MKALALTFQGLTDVCSAEIKELIGASGKEINEGVVFDGELEDIFSVCYRAQSVCRVLLLVSEGKISELKIPAEYLKGTISINGKTTTKANELSENIKANKVYKNADVPFYLHFEDDKNWLGIDLTDDISKRDYRIFVGSETLKGGTAYAVMRLSGYDSKKKLIDPNCRAGSIAIETALYALKFPVRNYSKDKMPFTKVFREFDFEKFYKEQDKEIKESVSGSIIALSDQFPSVQATRKNAKIAGVVKAIDFSRTSVDWLDLKFDKNSIDCIATQPLEMTKTFPPEKFKKQAALFFERAKVILKKNSKIGIVLRQGAEEYKAAAKGFSVEHERTIKQGQEEWKIVVLKQ
jgi:23S rRNA G2445 N2-methylase RlmL